MASSSLPCLASWLASTDRKSTRLNSSHLVISYAVFCLKKKNLSSFVGLLPRVKQSGEASYSGGITFRCNSYLRTLLIESSWHVFFKETGRTQYSPLPPITTISQ